MQRRKVPRALIGVFGALGLISFVTAACSTHVELPPEDPGPPRAARSGENNDGFNQEELGQLDELLDGAVSAPSAAGSEPPAPPDSGAKRPSDHLRPAP